MCRHSYRVHAEILAEGDHKKYKGRIVKIIKDLCKWIGVEIMEEKTMMAHIHLLDSIPQIAKFRIAASHLLRLTVNPVWIKMSSP